MKTTNDPIADELVQALNQNQAAYDAKTISYTTYRDTRDALYTKVDAQSANVQSLVWSHQL